MTRWLIHKAQPVPPIFQLEVVARGIYWAAHHTPRELFVGGSKWWPSEATSLCLGLADRYLGRTG